MLYDALLLFVLVLVPVLAVQAFSAWQLARHEAALSSVVLRVAVSKLNERGPIVAEQIYSALHALGDHYSLWDAFWGKPHPRFSLEIASVGNLIQFFLWVPKLYRNVLESQIYAQYPDVEIEEVADYARQPFPPFDGRLERWRDSDVPAVEAPADTRLPVPAEAALSSDLFRFAVTAELALENPMVYPIKRYSQFEDKLTRVVTEPLAGITATLSKLNATDEQAWIQFVAQPVGHWWRHRALRCLRILKTGLFNHFHTLNAFAIRFYLVRGFWKRLFCMPVYFVFWVLRGFHTNELVTSVHSEDVKEQVSSSHDREDPIMAAADKVSRLSFDLNVRVVYIPRRENLDLANVKLQEIAGSFRQFNLPSLNGFHLARANQHNAALLQRYRQRALAKPFIVNVEELATLYHMPYKDVGTPNVLWVTSRKLEPPHDLPVSGTVPPSDLTVLGTTNFRGHKQLFGIKGGDRRRHVYIIGKTGMGKSVLLENMISSDVNSGRGLAVVDPHGDLAESVLNFIPSFRTNDVVILDPSDTSHPFAFNMLESGNDPNQRSLITSGLLGVFKKMYAESWGPRLEHILRNCLLALAEFPNSSMLGIMRILVDNEYRRKVVENVSNPLVKSFWVDEFGKMQDKLRTEAISPIQNKVGQFLSSPMIRNIVGQVKSTVNIRFMMDTGKIIIVNLSKGKIGEDNSSLLGSMLITKFQLDAMSRADIAEKDRKDFYLYVDEFQNFATDAFATILSEARKYKLNLTMANQYISQMPEEVRDAVFGNVGTSICFQVGFDDAEYFSNQYSEEVLPNDIVTLAKYTAYTKLMIDGMPSKTFSVATLPPPQLDEDPARREKIVRLSRERYCTPREVVEDKILRWSESGKRLDERKAPRALPKPEIKKT